MRETVSSPFLPLLKQNSISSMWEEDDPPSPVPPPHQAHIPPDDPDDDIEPILPPYIVQVHNYDEVLRTIKEQLGYRLTRQLKDVPMFRLHDLEVRIQSRWIRKVRDILQLGRTGQQVSQGQLTYLRRHIGWLERYTLSQAIERDKMLSTLTDRHPEYFFPPAKRAGCLECRSTHDHANSMTVCFSLDQHGPQKPEDIHPGHSRRAGLQAIYVGTQNVYLHPALLPKIVNLSIIRDDIHYQVGFEPPYREHWVVPERCLFSLLDSRGVVLGANHCYPLIVEFVKNPDEDPSLPLSQHLIGFLKVLVKLKNRYHGSIAMVLYPPLPESLPEGNTRMYQEELRKYEETCKMARFLGEIVGVVVFCFDLFEVESQDSRGWYRRKMGWAREALFGKTRKPTKEWFNRQLHGIEFLLGVLSAARTA